MTARVHVARLALPADDLVAPRYCFAEFAGTSVEEAVSAAVDWDADPTHYGEHAPVAKNVVVEYLLHPEDRVNGWVVVDEPQFLR